MAPSAPSMLRHLDPSRRPGESRSTTVLSPALDQAVFFLRSHAVTLSAADGVNVSSSMAVGKALEAQLSVPVHSLRVTAHHPEHFFVTFTQPAHQVNAVRRGSIRVDGACFNISPWHEHDLATFDSLLLHVRVVVEKFFMHFWSVEGAEEILGRRVRVDRLDSRTLERGWRTGRRPLHAPPTPSRAVCRRPAPTTMTPPSRWWPLHLGRWGWRTAKGATACIAWLMPPLPAWVAGAALGTAARETATTREDRVQVDTGPGRTSSFAAAPRVLLALRLRSAVEADPRRPGADRGSPRAVARGLGGPLRQLDASRGPHVRAPLLQGLPRPRSPPLRPPSPPLLRGPTPAGRTRSRNSSGRPRSPP
ncbi:uncharacterized protein LOC123408414 [Hordeum vulgare subsp. vulgare]|uniref:uncharacterized protein LOC123408414 n=1 Tax=Hordeum vulgare subsp. vulgare TaxID=112509 RepID=UPI001D1A5670|nr:uncharacterized protein LOC123408414 [Hordeum vulgare subsp. vulgare]